MYPNVHCSIIHNSQDMKATQVPINRWMHKEDVVYTQTHTHTHTMEYYSVIKKEWNLAICDNMEGPREYCAKWNKSEKDK